MAASGVKTAKAAGSCELCGPTQLRLFLEKNGFRLLQCQNCGLVFQDPSAVTLDLNEFYQDRYRPEDFLPQRPAKVRKSHRELRLLERLISGRELIDVGCSYGFFVDVARQRGWNAKGVEVSQMAAEFARQTYGLEIFHGYLEQAAFPAESFDVVTIRHVLEHVPEPLAMLAEARRILKPGGLLLVAVPNVNCLGFKVAGVDWWWIDPPTHLYYFTPQTLQRALESAGFRIVHTQTERGDDWNFLTTLLYAINARIKRRFSRNGGGADGAANADVPGTLLQRRAGRRKTVERVTSVLHGIGYPMSWLIWKMGRGSEVLTVARKR